MTIRTRLAIAALLPLLTAGVIALALAFSYVSLEAVRQRGEAAKQMATTTNELNGLVGEYLVSHQERSKQQFLAEHEALAQLVVSVQLQDPAERELLDRIRVNSIGMKESFLSLASNLERSQGGENQALVGEVSELLRNEVLARTRTVVSDAVRLEVLLDADIADTESVAGILIALAAASATVLTAILLALMSRSIARSLAAIRKGTEIVGSGHLEHKLRLTSQDELGELARSFDGMAERLQAVTVSKDKLEQEVAERRRVERALNESEHRYRHVFESMQEAFHIQEVILDDAGRPVDLRFVEVNPAMERLLGRARIEVVGHLRSEVIGPLDQQAAEFVGRVLAVDGPLHIERYISAQNRWFDVVSYALGPRTIATLNVDITERKMAEQLKDAFIGMVSHEIKTPLTVIIGALSVANLEGLQPEQTRELLADAVANANILSDIVDNLLELSRSQANRLVLNVEPVDVAPTARGVAQTLENKSAIHHLSVDIPAGLPRVRADPVRLERIIYNLVDNAIKYSPEGGDVRISAKPEDDHLVVSVTDHGLGISPDEQPRLFQRFERLSMDAPGSPHGVGLGLNVCRILVEAQGGRIWVESAPGKGSTFFFSVPVANPAG